MYEQEGYDLIGAAIEVYNEMKHGLLEDVYQECLEKELSDRNIPFESQKTLHIYFKGYKLNKYYRPDLYVYDGIVVELKAIKAIGNNEMAQLINYLKLSRKHVGYLLNFGHPEKLDWHRIVI